MDRKAIKRRSKDLKTKWTGFYGSTSTHIADYYGDPALIKPLIEALGRIGVERVRVGVIQALAKTGDSRAIEPLVRVLQYDIAPLMRGVAAAALGELKGEYAFYYLCEALWTTPGALRLGEKTPDVVSDDANMCHQVYRGMPEYTPTRMIRAITSAMLKIDHSGSVALFRKALGNAKLRSRAIYALVIARDTQTNVTLIQMMGEADAKTREDILWAFERMGDSGVIEQLIDMMLDGKMSDMCARALKKIEEREHKKKKRRGWAPMSRTGQRLAETIQNDSDIDRKRRAIDHIATFLASGGIDVVKPLLDDEDSRALWPSAARTLAKRLNDKEMYGLMTQMLERDDADAKYAAVCALNGNLAPGVGDIMKDLMYSSHNDKKVYDEAVLGLCYYVQNAAINDLNRSLLITSLGYSNNTNAYFTLVHILKRYDFNKERVHTRVQAASLLYRFGRADAIALLLKIINRGQDDKPLLEPADESIGKILRSLLKRDDAPDKDTLDLAARVAENRRISDATCLAAVRLMAAANDKAYRHVMIKCSVREHPEIKQVANAAIEKMSDAADVVVVDFLRDSL